MTPEERLTRIETDIDKQNEGIRALIVVARTCLNSIQEMGDRHEKDHQHMLAELGKLHEAQAATDEKLNILVEHEEVLDRTIKSLVETVEKILRKDNGQK